MQQFINHLYPKLRANWGAGINRFVRGLLGSWLKAKGDRTTPRTKPASYFTWDGVGFGE